jgi:hypothetical protein
MANFSGSVDGVHAGFLSFRAFCQTGRENSMEKGRRNDKMLDDRDGIKQTFCFVDKAFCDIPCLPIIFFRRNFIKFDFDQF